MDRVLMSDTDIMSDIDNMIFVGYVLVVLNSKNIY